jgi:hypothetical protein
MNNSKYFYDVDPSTGTLVRKERSTFLAPPGGPRPVPRDPSLAKLNDGIASEGFLSRQGERVGKEESGPRKQPDAFRAQDDVSRVRSPSQLSPRIPKVPPKEDAPTDPTDDASLRFK